MTRDGATRWVLVLRPGSAEAPRRLGGLPIALRLALDAQAAGAEALVLPPEAALPRTLFRDERLRLPVLETPPPGALSVSRRASVVQHRGLLKALLESGLADDRDLDATPFAFEAPYGFAPIDVVDAPSARRAEAALFRSLRKPADGWTSRWLNRYLSLALSRWLVKTPLRPNQLSLCILAVGLYGAFLASRGDWASVAIGGLLFQAQSVLDGCDGEMSRITYRGSLLGEWLDTIGDDLTNYAFFGAAAWGLWNVTGSWIYLLTGGVTVLCGVLGSGIEYRYLIRIGSGDLLKYPLTAPGTEAEPGLMSAIQPLFKRDTFVFITCLAALANQLAVMSVVFALGAMGVLASVIGAELRMARERRAGT